MSMYSHSRPRETTFSDTGASSVGRWACGRPGLSIFCLAERSLQGR